MLVWLRRGLVCLLSRDSDVLVGWGMMWLIGLVKIDWAGSEQKVGPYIVCLAFSGFLGNFQVSHFFNIWIFDTSLGVWTAMHWLLVLLQSLILVRSIYCLLKSAFLSSHTTSISSSCLVLYYQNPPPKLSLSLSLSFIFYFLLLL